MNEKLGHNNNPLGMAIQDYQLGIDTISPVTFDAFKPIKPALLEYLIASKATNSAYIEVLSNHSRNRIGRCITTIIQCDKVKDALDKGSLDLAKTADRKKILSAIKTIDHRTTLASKAVDHISWMALSPEKRAKIKERRGNHQR